MVVLPAQCPSQACTCPGGLLLSEQTLFEDYESPDIAGLVFWQRQSQTRDHRSAATYGWRPFSNPRKTYSGC